MVHRPNGIEHQEFYAFSYIFDLAISVGIVHDHSGGTVTVSQFRDAAEHSKLSRDEWILIDFTSTNRKENEQFSAQSQILMHFVFYFF